MDAGLATANADSTSLKRKRSQSNGSPTYLNPPAKVPRETPVTGQIEINYLARRLAHDLPLVTVNDSLASILSLLGVYSAVLERHESLAHNLGARPLGPMLIKRFERMFDGPPRTLKSPIGRDGQPTNVTWLDVVEHARTNPDQFTLNHMSDGLRVCEFQTKQCRVQISEDDFMLIQSGLPQKMIPPQPIPEDEEKELGTLEIVEQNVGQICSLADQVAARARQFNHRLRSRKQAIIERRATDASISGSVLRGSSPSNVAMMNGLPLQAPLSPSGFIAVNNHPGEDNPLDQADVNGHADASTVSQAIRDELLQSFYTAADRRPIHGATNGISSAPPHYPSPAFATPGRQNFPSKSSRVVTGSRSTNPDDQQLAASLLSYGTNSSTPTQAATPAAGPPTQGHRPSAAEKEDGGPFRAEMVARLETIPKGDRIFPSCDRCRRLHIDCLKNLTACIGCTKKHARCTWREVREEEVRNSRAATAVMSNAANGEVNMTDGRQSKTAQSRSPSEQLQDNGEQQQYPPQYDQQYSEDVPYRTHDEEVQAARSLAMAAVADAASQAQMQMQRDTLGISNAANGIMKLEEAHNNVDPSLQSAEANQLST